MSSFQDFFRKNKYAIAISVFIVAGVLIYFSTRENNTSPTTLTYSHRDARMSNLTNRGTRPDRDIRGPPQEDTTRYRGKKELLRLPPLRPTHLSMGPVKSLRETIESKTPLKPITIAGDN